MNATNETPRTSESFTVTAELVPGCMIDGRFVPAGHDTREILSATESSPSLAARICKCRAFGRAGWTAAVFGACEVRLSTGDVSRVAAEHGITVTTD